MNLLKILKNKEFKIDINNLLSNVVKVLLCLFVFSTIFPGGSSKAIILTSFGLLMILWLVIERKQFIDFFIKPNLLMYSIYLWLAINIIFIATGYAPLLKGFLNNSIRIGFTSVIFIYLLKTNKISELKTIVVFSISLIIIINIWTIIANYKEYNISRLLSTGIMDTRIGIGSYVYIYGLIFFIIVEIYSVFKNNNKRWISIILTIISIYTIYKAEFMISIFLVLLGLMLIILKIDNIKKLIIFITTSVICIFIMSPIIGNVFANLGEKSDNYNLKLRFNDLSEVFLEKSLDNTVDLKNRMEVYTKSINVFMERPVFGNGFKPDSEIGGHSMILDELAKYGIVGNIPLGIMLYAICSSIIKSFKYEEQKNIYFICLTIFFCLAFINTAMFAAIFYFLFDLCPAIIYLYIETDNNKKDICRRI